MARKQMTRKQKKPKPSKQNKTRNLRKTKANKNKSKNMRRRTRSKKGGNKNCNYVPTFFLPPGGMYDVGSDTNGLGKGFYYGLNQCLAPGYPISTVGIKQSRNVKKGQKGGSQFRSIKDLARSTMSTIEKLYAEVTTKPFTINEDPNVLKQPINKKTKKQTRKRKNLNQIIKNANKKVSSM
jgi:hypothetical protein